jgi:predicted transcriptional regulator of viral defense system
VDLDFNYVGAVDRAGMLDEEKCVTQLGQECPSLAVKAPSEGLTIQRGRTKIRLRAGNEIATVEVASGFVGEGWQTTVWPSAAARSASANRNARSSSCRVQSEPRAPMTADAGEAVDSATAGTCESAADGGTGRSPHPRGRPRIGIVGTLKVRSSGTMRGKDVPKSGLGGPNRAILTRLNRTFPGPFGVGEAMETLGLERARTKRLLAYLAARGWLARVRRGLYTTVPLEVEDPGSWLADPWAVAAKTFAPCYIGGWTALHHWELTEQLFRSVVVFTGSAVRNKERSVQGTTFRLRQISDEHIFGTKTTWREKVAVKISDAERTLVDVLDRPDVGGGIRHVADCLEEWSVSERPSAEKLIDYAERLGNRTVFKRLGFLLEARGVEDPMLIEACSKRLSAGLSPLDPSASAKGRVLKRWRLRVNARA